VVTFAPSSALHRRAPTHERGQRSDAHAATHVARLSQPSRRRAGDDTRCWVALAHVPAPALPPKVLSHVYVKEYIDDGITGMLLERREYPAILRNSWGTMARLHRLRRNSAISARSR